MNYDGAARVCEKSKGLASNAEFKAMAVKLDVADSQSVQSMVDLAVSEFGRIDYLVNATGVCAAEPYININILLS